MSYIEWLRGQVGTRKVFISYASIVLRDEAGRVLLQRRTDFDAWGLPGGIQELGESIWDCAHRELGEETGLNSGALSLVGVYSDPRWDVVYPNGDQVQQHTVCFTGQLSGGQMQPDGMETSEQEFFDPDTLPFERMASFYRAMIHDALSGGPPAFSLPFAQPEAISQTGLMLELLGRQPFIGVSAVAIVADENGKLLMIQRADDGEWDFPGGYLNLGENSAYAAFREVHEETGLRIQIERILGIHSPAELWPYPIGARVQRVAAVFQTRVAGGMLKSRSDEASSIAWLTPDEILRQEGKPVLQRLKRAVLAAFDRTHLDQEVFPDFFATGY